jgi:ATP-dependent Lon protease
MFMGNWHPNNAYYKGNIVYIASTDKYYICSLKHTSSNLGFPSPEDLYWVLIDDKFLRKESVETNYVPILTSPFEYQHEYLEEVSSERKSLKRKVQQEVYDYKRKKNNREQESLHDQILLMNLDISTKSFLLDKYENTQKMTGSDYSKGMAWIKIAATIPFGVFKELDVKSTDSPTKIKQFFNKVKDKLDENIHGMQDVKQEILEFVARKITNPDGRGHVLALCGFPGTGKTKIIKTLAEALNMPFYQINCGGLNDAAALMGHSETYVGSKPGKIVEILQTSPCMNPILYFDELDKISECKATEINGILTHLFDEEQNNKFQDNYLSNINLDLSKAFFVLAFNDASKIDSVVFDRLKVIYINKPTLEDKIHICKDKIIPELISSINFDKNRVIEMSNETIEYICTQKCSKETGIRQLRKSLEKVLNKLNYDILIQDKNLEKHTKRDNQQINYIITRKYIDNVLEDSNAHNNDHLSMYI